MVHATCAALHCLSSSHTDKDLKFHQFPHDAERRKIWITACKRSDVIDKDWDFFKHKYLCSLHFEKCMYSKKEHLKKSAVPSLHLSEKPLQHDSSTQTVESIQYANQQSENDVSILYIMPKVVMSSTTAYTQTEDSLPCDIKHVNIKEEIITHTMIKEGSESVEQDEEIKTEYDDDADKNSDSEAFEEDVEIKTEIVENEILPLLKSTQSLQYVDLEITKDDETLSTQAKNLLQDIDQGLTAPIVNRTSTYPINTSTMQILKIEMDESIQTDRVIVLNQNADGSAGSINPEECRCKRNNYLGMTRLQFYKACSKFLSANFAIAVRRRMHLDDVAKAKSSGRVRRRITRVSESVELNATGCGEVVAPDVVIASTETAADSAETDLDAIDHVKASATDCAQSVEPKRPAACDLDKKDWDITVNDHYDHVRQRVSDVSPPGSLQSIPRLVSEASGVTVKKRKRKIVRNFLENLAEGSELDSDLGEDFDLDEITSSGASMARNIPDDDDLDESMSKIINSMRE